MKDDLLFHIVEKKDWKRFKKDGIYSPQTLDEEGFIHCSTGEHINKTANRLFKNKRHLWLLIIDANRVDAPIKYEKNTTQEHDFPHIYGPLNAAAILDRISLNPDKNGDFGLSFKEK